MINLTALVAREHVTDLRQAAERERRTASSDVEGTAPAIELRLVGADEAHVVRRLAELDDAPELVGQVLLALIDGDAVAGLSLHDLRVVADPFVSTRDAVALLRLRAELVTTARARRRWLPRILSPRAACFMQPTPAARTGGAGDVTRRRRRAGRSDVQDRLASPVFRTIRGRWG
jgi:hypothetical protein